MFLFLNKIPNNIFCGLFLKIIQESIIIKLAPSMDIEIDRDKIINKFKRNGHILTRNCFDMIVEHLKQSSHASQRLDEIIRKSNEMVIMNQ